MHVLIVTQYFHPENFRINELARALAAAGDRVTVLTGKPNYPGGALYPGHRLGGVQRERFGDVDVIRVPLLPRGAGGGARLALNYLSFAACASLLGPFVAPRDIDAIFVYEPSPITVALPAIVLRALRRRPMLLWVLDLWPESLAATGAVGDRRVLAAVGRVVRWIYRRCDLILLPSRGFARSVEGLGADPARVRYWPQSAEDVFLSPGDPARVPVPLPDGGFRVMFAGNLGAAQGVDTILEAATLVAERRDLHWLIVGDGRRRGWLEAEIARRGLGATVHLLGAHPVTTMPAFFAAADALLVTLRRDPIFALTIPAKVQAYLASGRPLVAALDGEGARLVDEAGAGVSCPADDPRALADAVLRLAATPPAERAAMAARARRYYAEHFDKGRLLGQLRDWMRTLAAGGEATR